MFVLRKLADWIEAERGRFSLLLPVAMGAAILVYFGLPKEPPLWLGGALLLAAIAMLIAGWRYPAARFIAALALASTLGFTRAALRTDAEPPLTHIPSGALEVSGIVTRIEFLPASRRITLDDPSLDHNPALKRALRLRLRANDPTALRIGDGVSAYAMLFGPDRPAYPGAWDSARQDFFGGIAATGFALSPIVITTPAAPDAIADTLQNLRAHIAETIAATLPINTGTVATTLLTGDEQAIPPQERQNFITAGLAHILAVAGLHVGIVMGLAFWATRFLLSLHERLALRLPVKPIAAVAALLAGAGYAALTGAHLPILRSLAMASLATLGVIAGRRALSLRGLAIAATLILLATPEAIIGVSFQMSFSAVLALIAGYDALQLHLARLRAARPMMVHVIALAFTSLLAGGASMPFAAFQFQQIQPYWIPANLIAVPLTAFWILPWGLAALALMPFGLAAPPLIAMSWGIGIILWLTSRIAAWPHAMLPIAPMPDEAILLIAAGLIWLCIWRATPRLAGLGLILAGLGVAGAARPPDVLVSPDARLIAIRSDAQIYLIRQPKAEDFTLAQWAPVWGGAPLVPAHCTASTCRLGPVLLALSPPEACGDAKLIVSPGPLRGACAPIAAIDRFSVFHNGATAAWINGRGITLRSDRETQGERPWVMPYPK